MATDVYSVRLTGRIRDTAPAEDTPGGGELGLSPDPACEVEVELVDDILGTAGETMTALVLTPAGIALPWYAAALTFFNSLRVSVGGTSSTGTGRHYTMHPDVVSTARQTTHVMTRGPRGNSFCLQLPVTPSYRAVLLGRWDNNDLAGTVVFPGEVGALAFVAPDGSTYGMDLVNAESPVAYRRPLGNYAGSPLRTGGGGGGPPNSGLDELLLDTDLRQDWATNRAPPMQSWTEVDVYAAHFPGDSYSQRWSITPRGEPQAHIVRVDADIEAAIDGDIVSSVIGDVVVFDYAETSYSDGGSNAADIIATNLPTVGVVIAPGAVVVSGRFWLDPEITGDLSPMTYFYKSTLAAWQSFLSFSPHPPGDQTEPLNTPRRPIFIHLHDGWCVMADHQAHHHSSWAYGVEGSALFDPEASSKKAWFAEAAFQRFDPDGFSSDQVFPGAEELGGALRWRDRPWDETDSNSYGDPSQYDQVAGNTSLNNVMSWFTNTNTSRRALVIHRLDLMFDSSEDPSLLGSTGDGIHYLADRPGVLGWSYQSNTRITDTYDSNPTAADGILHHALRVIPTGLPNSGEGTEYDGGLGPGAGTNGNAGALFWRDSTDSGHNVVRWFTCASSSVVDAWDFEHRHRRIEWYIRQEIRGYTWAFYHGSQNNWSDGIKIENADFSSPPTATLAANLQDALPMRVRQIEICDSDDTVRQILVLASDMF